MSHRIFWPTVAALALGGLTLVLSPTTAQRPGGGGPGGPGGMPGGSPGMPGRFVVANASSSQVLILDTATGQVYRAKEEDFKKMSELPRVGMGRPGGGDARPDRENKKKEDARPTPKEQSETLLDPRREDDAPPRRQEQE